MLHISRRTIRHLFGVSGGRCYFPGCEHRDLEDGTPVLQIARICATASGGARYHRELPLSAAAKPENLILLCPPHHILVDKYPERYSIQWLFEIKSQRESRKITVSSLFADGIAGADASSGVLIRPVVGDGNLIAGRDVHVKVGHNYEKERSKSNVELLRESLNVWRGEQHNPSEEFWQDFFSSRSPVLTFVTGNRPFVVYSKCYVGGKRIDNSGGHVADFLVQHQGNVDIIEIKPPTVALVGSRYRDGVFSPSRQLVGACIQVLEYRRSFAEQLPLLRCSTPELDGPSPRCHVIAGCVGNLTPVERRSFELYRRNFTGVNIMAYDELFDNVHYLVGGSDS